MITATILYWRDIPAQLIIGKGRDAKKYKLPDKYEKAIDRCAMKVGAKDSDSYLKDWRKATITLEDSNTDVLMQEASRIQREYSDEKLKELVRNGGWQKPPKEDEKKEL